MKIKELFEDHEGQSSLFTTIIKPHKQRIEGPMVPKASSSHVGDINYTPGKAALDNEYEETEEFTKTSIPNKQVILDDPRN
jgi:hypothetical protein